MTLNKFEQDRKDFILATLAKGKAVRFENEWFVKIIDKWEEDTSLSKVGVEQSDLKCCYSNGFANHVAWWSDLYHVSEQEINEIPKT